MFSSTTSSERLYHITQHCAYEIIITRYVQRRLLAGGTHAAVIYMSTVRIVKVRVLRVIAIKSVRYRKRRTQTRTDYFHSGNDRIYYTLHIYLHTHTHTLTNV